jgi:hypothetical protein
MTMPQGSERAGLDVEQAANNAKAIAQTKAGILIGALTRSFIRGLPSGSEYN